MKGMTVKRILATFLSAAMVVTMFPALGGTGVVVANAASTVTNENLFKYPTFEEDIPLEEHNDSNQNNKVGNWFYYQNTVKKEQGNAHTGDWAVSLGKTNDALEQDVPNLQKGATYKVSVWAKNTNPSGVKAYMCLKFYGGNEKKVLIDSTDYKKYEVEFIYTGDTSGKNTRAAIWIENGTSGNVYVDDWGFEISSNLKSISVENGSLSAEYKEDYTGEMKSSDFDISYTSSLESGVAKKLDIIEEDVSGKTLTMNFAPIAAQPVEQNITVTATYKPNNQPLIVDFNIGASGDEIVEATLTGISAKNGTVTASLDKVPTVDPVKGDFILEYKVKDGEFAPTEIKEFAYDKENKTVTLQFDKISGAVDAKNVTVKVIYKDTLKTADFAVELESGIKYYVNASEGNDSNDGMSEATAWKTIDKVNTVVFQPGDQILFKAGEEWTGALKPQGSGVDGVPIIIASYGEGKKPLLKPGEDWTISHMNIANKVVRSPRVNNVITFYNQQYWEVRNLELWDPTYEQNSNTYVYRRGINISAQDTGDLHYFKFDNLTIHGFRGPISNEGKSSGGIIMTVTTDLYDASKRVPTAVHDISITNCEMYNLGRSGINFISPWTTREGEKWNKYKPFGYKGVGAWKPYENFRLSNNTIYNIDGDGAIIDGCKDAIVDHNTVYRAVYNCWFGVGLFNWNSDNVVFEYNEVYESSPADALLGAGDGQGIEIDALNQNTLVQYNYLHNNAGGVFMWCSTEDLRGFDGIYRYNISQNDGAKHGVIDWRPGHEGSMAYNNTIYLNDSEERTWMNNGYTGGKSDATFYNNIVVNKGKMTVKSFNEEEIDYESNIFNGFDQVPSNDSTIIQEDPMLVAPGTGEKGIDSLEGYKLQSGSLAIDAGMNIENNGGKDYFGTQLTDGKTDIGAAEYVAPDKIGLGETIKEAEEIDKTLYTDETIKVLEESLAQAKEVFDNPDAKQDEIDAATASLRTAIEGLVKKDEPDKIALGETIKEAEEIDKTLYTDETIKMLEESLAQAKEVFDNPDAKQDEIDAATASLRIAIERLVNKDEPDKIGLGETIKEAEEIDKTLYTDETIKMLEESLAQAKEVLDNPDAKQDEIDAAIASLRIAIERLVKKDEPDKIGLGETIKEAEEIDKTLYTDETIKMLEESLAQAKEVFDNPDAKQDEIDAAIASLRTAIKGLDKKDDGIVVPPTPEKPEEPQEPNGAQNTKPQTSDNKEVVKTGDSSAVIPMAVLSLTALGIIIIAVKKRKLYN